MFCALIRSGTFGVFGTKLSPTKHHSIYLQHPLNDPGTKSCNKALNDWEKCGEKLATLSLPIFLTACSRFLQMTSQTTCRKRLVSRSISHKTVLLPFLLLLPFLSPAPTHSSRHFLLHDCTTIFGLKNNNLFKTMERRIKRK